MTGHADSDTVRAIRYANRFEAIAADGYEGRPYRDRLLALAAEVRGRGALAGLVATALAIMVEAIEDGDPAGRFAPKITILREAVGAIVTPE